MSQNNQCLPLFTFSLLVVSCVVPHNKNADKKDASSYVGYPLEKSAYLKKDLPWFARFQEGEPPVAGFPGETYEAKKQCMQKWRDAKYGLFLHWGPQIKGGEYSLSSDNLQQFNPADFNAEEWAFAAKRLGFRYMVVTVKHHSDFCIYDSKYTDHDIIDATLFNRDPIKELSLACAKYDFMLVPYYSVWDIHHQDYSSEIENPGYKIYQEYMLNQAKELLTNYGPITSLWLDGEWVNSWTVERVEELRKGIRDLQSNVVIVNRLGQRRHGDKRHFFYGTGAGAQRENLKGWTVESDRPEWNIPVEEKGSFNCEITYASFVKSGRFELTIAGQSFNHTVEKIQIDPKTKLTPLIVISKIFTLGNVELTRVRYKSTVKSINITDEAIRLNQGLMTFREVTRIPN